MIRNHEIREKKNKEYKDFTIYPKFGPMLRYKVKDEQYRKENGFMDVVKNLSPTKLKRNDLFCYAFYKGN